MIKKSNTEVSVALEFEPSLHAVPKVAAAGRAEVSAQMRRVALRYGVPVVCDRDLAEHLADLEVEAEIPSELYESVAQLLYDLEEV